MYYCWKFYICVYKKIPASKQHLVSGFTVLYLIVLYCTGCVLCCALLLVFCCIALCCIMLCWDVLCCVGMFCIVSYCIVLCSVKLYCKLLLLLHRRVWCACWIRWQSGAGAEGVRWPVCQFPLFWQRGVYGGMTFIISQLLSTNKVGSWRSTDAGAVFTWCCVTSKTDLDNNRFCPFSGYRLMTWMHLKWPILQYIQIQIFVF